jgi:hypothetical protein
MAAVFLCAPLPDDPPVDNREDLSGQFSPLHSTDFIERQHFLLNRSRRLVDLLSVERFNAPELLANSGRFL